MWYLAQNMAQSEVEHASTMREMLQSTTRNLIIVSAAFCMISSLLISINWDASRIMLLLAGILVVGLIFVLAHRLVANHLLPGLVTWMSGMIITILIGCWLMKNPGLVLVTSILPLIAAITIGGWAGLTAEAVVIGMVWLVGQAPFGSLPPEYLVVVTVGAGALNGLLGWTVSRELLNTAIWSMASYDRVRKTLSEVQDRQVELAQSQEDLILANSELSRLSNRLKALEKIAEDARQATTEFVANVSHELRTPLNMIIGYADLISRSPQVYGSRLPSSLLTDIVAILRNAQHLAALVNDVLDLSQVEAGRMALSRSWVPLNKTINEALSVVKGLYESKGLYLTSDVPEDLPPIFCDETRIRQVIINLLSNAGRFTEHGGVNLKCELVEKGVFVQITDTGSGIAKENQERIFEPFQQADTSIRRQYGGSGLGLTISKQFIEMHGGKMSLESLLGEGTTFSFSLPIEYSPATLALDPGQTRLRSIVPDDEVGFHIRSRRSQAPPSLTAKRYVVIDHEQTLQKLLHRYLSGSTVELLPDISTAVEALNRSPAQALILNVPRSEDVRSTILSNLPYGTPAITCWLPGEVEAANRLGVVEYLIKPLTCEKLLATLRNLKFKVKTVLIVDDEEDELHLFARDLESDEHSYAILQVTNGQRALSMLRSRHPDLMLLDLTMPGFNGFQVLEEKRRDSTISNIPVIIISSRDPSGDPIISDTFTVTHSGGLSQRNLITCIQALSDILAPSTISGNKS